VINKEKKEMNRFTLRSALVLAVVLLLAGATTSFAQVIFSASAGNPQVRIGGMSETVGDITLTASGLATFPAGSGNAVITLTYSTTISNKTTASSTATCVFGAVCGTAAGTAVPATTGVVPANAMVIGPAAGSTMGIVVYVKNLAAGTANTTINWTVAGNTLTITFAPAAGGTIAFFNGVVNAAITIHGVRLNAAGLGIPPTLPTVSTFVNTTPSANLQLAAGSTSLTVGTLAVTLGSVSRISGSTNINDAYYGLINTLVTNTFGAPTAIGTATKAGTCGGTACNTAINLNPKSSYTNCGFRSIPEGAAAGGTVIITGDEPTIWRTGARDFGSNGGNNGIGIKIVEGYPGALTSVTDEKGKSGDAAVWPTGITHEVDGGTRIRIDLTGVPAQVVAGSPIRVVASNATAVTNVSGLSADLNGNTQCSVGSCGTTGTSPQTALADVRSPSGGALSVEYEVTSNTGGTSGTASGIAIPIFLWQSSSPVDLGTINISVRLGPILGSTVVRFSDGQTASTSTVSIGTCNTELFYPFVTNTAGFDTGIYVVNGGQTRSGSSGESGTCTARFFDGSTTGSTAVKSSTLPTLGPGQSFSFTASDATLGKPGFGNGYVQITCTFEYAHGAAYVTFGYGSAAVGSAPPGTMYLALAGTPDNGSTSGINGQ
jgi:hypothetical protein